MDEAREIGAIVPSGLLGRWVGAVWRAAWILIVLVGLATAGIAYYTATHFAVSTDTSDMLSRELPFRKTYLDYKAAFPQFADTIAIVIDGETPDGAEDAAAAMTARLKTDPAKFGSVFYAAGEPFFRENGLLYLETEELQALSDRLAQAQPLLGSLAEDTSLRGFLGILTQAVEQADQDEAATAALTPVLDGIAAALDAERDGRRYRLSWIELMQDEPPDALDRRQIILIQPPLDFSRFKPGTEAMEAVRSLAAALGLVKENGVRVRLTGSVPLREEELDSVWEGASTAGLISLTLVFGLLFLGLRSMRLVVAVLATLLVGLIWTAGFAIFAIGYLNLISVAFAVLFIGLAVDFGIHFSLRFQEEFEGVHNHRAALDRAARGVGPALTLSAVCAAIAFFSFLPTAYKGISELGLIAGAGMFIALALNYTLLPALLSVMPKARWKTGLFAAGKVRRMRDVVGGQLRRRSRIVAYAALVLGLLALALATQIRFDFNPLNLNDPTKESVQTVQDLMADSRTTPETLSVLAPDLDEAAALAEQLERLDVVDRAVTLRDFVPKNQEEKLAIIEQMALFLTPLLTPVEGAAPPSPAENRQALAEFRQALTELVAAGRADAFEADIPGLIDRIAALEARLDAAPARAPARLETLETSLLAYLPARLEALGRSLEARPVTLEDLPAGIRERQIAADGRARVEVFPSESVSDNEALRRFVEGVRSVAPNATDSSVVLLEAGDAVVAAFWQASLTALSLIVLLLAVLVRNPWEVGLILLPLGLAAVLTVALAVLLGLSFNFANIIVLPLLLGLGVASAIHLVLRERTVESAAALSETSTPRAVLFSALTTIGSFGSLAISGHRGTASMGQLLTIAITMTLVCTLVVLPALMELRKRRAAARGR